MFGCCYHATVKEEVHCNVLISSSFHKFSSFWGFSLVNTCNFVEINSCNYDKQFTEKKNAKEDTEGTLHSMVNMSDIL